MNIFDTHSDTPFGLYRQKLDLYNDITNVSLGKLLKYRKKVFVSAFFSDKKKSNDECFEEFLESSAYYDSLVENHSDKAMIIKCAEDLKLCTERELFGTIKAIEDARLIDTKLERLELLYSMGVRQIIPVWGGESHIGGAWDADTGLTAFGKKTVLECERLGIIVDASHMSKKSFWDTAEVYDGMLLASHSDYTDICPHRRNLDKSQLSEIIRRKGIVGINLCMKHVNSKYENQAANENDDFIGEVAAHIYYCLECGGEKTLCLGCDFDGTKMSPHVRDVSDMDKLYERLIKDGIPQSVVEDIFFNNAYNFYIKNLK